MSCFQACQVIGLPECRINLAVSFHKDLYHAPLTRMPKHCVSYLSEAKKSTRAYEAYNKVSLRSPFYPFSDSFRQHSGCRSGQSTALARTTSGNEECSDNLDETAWLREGLFVQSKVCTSSSQRRSS